MRLSAQEAAGILGGDGANFTSSGNALGGADSLGADNVLEMLLLDARNKNAEGRHHRWHRRSQTSVNRVSSTR